MNNMTAFFTFTGPISPAARQRAEQLYRQQSTPQKGEQVRLNTLSVSFVNSYLQCMGFETDLEKSDSWDPVQQTLMDIADLPLKNLGSLECRPVLGDAQFVYVPPEVQSNRIGYLAVRISKSFREATLLGFVKQVSTELLPIGQLQSLESLLEYLEAIFEARQAELVAQSLPPRGAEEQRGKNINASSAKPSRTCVKLKQWFENIFEVGWQEVFTVLDTPPVYAAWNLRSNNFVSRGKLIDLNKQIAAQSVVLIVALYQKNLQEMDIIVEIHPQSGQTYLPANLQLSVLDSEEAAVMEAQTRSTNKNIQLQFSGETGERFSIKVALGNVSIIEDFVISGEQQ